jgi:hypothetical protein
MKRHSDNLLVSFSGGETSAFMAQWLHLTGDHSTAPGDYSTAPGDYSTEGNAFPSVGLNHSQP